MDLGRPVELYEFQIDGNYYRYTSYSEDVSKGLDTFLTVFCHRTKIEDTADINRGEIMVDLARNNPFAVLYRDMAPETAADLTVYRSHDLSTWETIWTGKVMGVKFNATQATVNGRPLLAALGRTGLRVPHQRSCPYDLYSEMCGVSRAAYAVTSTLGAVSGVTLTAAIFATKADDWFTGGYIRIGTTSKRRMIVDHAGTDITISHVFANDVAVGDSFTAYAGCDKLPGTCKNKFSDKLNYGGDEFLPNSNVFEEGFA